MLGHKTILIIALALFPVFAEEFSGARAFEHVKQAVEFGPRPAGSPAIRKLQAYIHAQLKSCRCDVQDDDFAAQTPNGSVSMKNIIARFPGAGREGSRTLVVTGHYDTKLMDGFVGANDGGSSTGLLLELARILATTPHRAHIWLVWLDGEEAVKEWSATDSTYGSRHLAKVWSDRGDLARIGAVINVDMIGDKNLDVPIEANSTPTLGRLAKHTADELGFNQQFLSESISIEDDHLPFLERGVPAVDLIDFNYGPANSYWHTTADTLDKLSPQSLEVVGKVVLGMLGSLDKPTPR